MASVIQVDDMDLFARNQHVAGVEIRVNTEFLRVSGACRAGFDSLENLFRDACVCLLKIHRNQFVIE